MAAEKIQNVDLTTSIVAAYVENNALGVEELPTLIRSVHAAIDELLNGERPPPAAKQEPAVPVRRSITPDYLVCLEDGRKFKSLRRHLQTKYNISPEVYRAKWRLPKDYPMVAPNYAKARSDLAKQAGLGQIGRKVAASKDGRGKT